jgi:hypothetical protein
MTKGFDEALRRLGIGPNTRFRELELIERRAAKRAGRSFADAMHEMYPHLTEREMKVIARDFTRRVLTGAKD